MSKHLRVFGVVTLICLLGGLVWCILNFREPVHQGKPLSVWLEAYLQSLYIQEEEGTATTAEQRGQEAAIRQIGANAVPHLMKMLQRKDSGIKSNAFMLLRKQPFIQTTPRTDMEYHNMALAGFQALGPIAKPAVPALIGLLDDPIRRSGAALCLGKIGPAASDAATRLVPWLEEQDVALRYSAANALGDIGRGTPEVVAALLRRLNDTNEFVEGSVELALGKLHAHPERVVPLLIHKLETDPKVMRFRVKALGEFGAEAKQAIPILLELYGTSAVPLKMDIANAIKVISPEAAARAGVK